MRAELAALPGVPESALTPDDAAALPDTAPPAPWTARARALTWWNRPGPAARDAIRALLPEALGRVRPLRCIGALLHYDASPVGPYNELIALLVLRRGDSLIVHVPFIAVDSPTSVVGGRANWALPKILARFTGNPATDTTLSASGDTWTINATARTRGLVLPFYLPTTTALVQTDTHQQTWTVRGRARGLTKPAHVTIDAQLSPGLADWFPTGHCTGALTTHLTASLPPARIAGR